MFTWDVAISRWLDGVLGGSFFWVSETPWTALLAAALFLTWMLWVSMKD